jgi:U6 snRNA-associated Sm-like protein LSm2
VELKNDISIRGTLKSVDQYLNIKLDDITVLDELKYPHLSSVKNIFIRGSVVRYVHLPAGEVDRGLLEDASRRGELCTLLLFGEGGGRCQSLWDCGLTRVCAFVEAANQAGKAR